MKDLKATSSNPFDFSAATASTSSESRKLDLTPILIGTSNTRAQELMIAVSNNPELHALANTALESGEPKDLIKLITVVLGEELIKTDSKILDGADEDQLSRLLESRRSDRSKSKSKGPKSSVLVCKTYISSMYAELVIREYWAKPYTGQANTEDFDAASLAGDQDAITRKVKSLQSKKSRLKALAAYNADAKIELEEVEAEIARLNELRPNTRTTTKVVVKDMNVDELRALISGIDPKTLPEDAQAKYLELMAKLG